MKTLMAISLLVGFVLSITGMLMLMQGPALVVTADCQDNPCLDPPCCNGDVNGDGSIDVADAIGLLAYLFSQGPEPETIDCGPDNTIGDLVITFDTIVDWDIYANCMPPTSADPWLMHFDLIYDNTQGATDVTVNIVSTRLVFNPPVGPSINVIVDPLTSGPVPAGASVSVTHTKVASINDLPNDCLLCDSTAWVEVIVEANGQLAIVTSPSFTVLCAF